MTEYLSVSTLTKYLKAKFDRDRYLERVYLTGEISNFRRRPNHQYFALKDEGAVIQATMWAGQFRKLDFELEEGMKVLAVGRISIYPPSGSYSINIESLVPDGVGALAVKFEQLKKKLTAEGLFEQRWKQTLPQFSKKIAVVTSPSGAVIRDIITTVQRRFPMSQIVLYPTKVQGQGSAEEIAGNIRRANQRGDFDVMIIGRGGGSIEDLWGFNEEIVVRAIFESRIPIISSVGHETDVTLADFVADSRAATPTAAAELATPNTKVDLINWANEQEKRLFNRLTHVIKIRRERVDKLSQSVVFRQPERLYDGHLQKLDRLCERLSVLTENKVANMKHRYELSAGKLIPTYGKIVEAKKNKTEQLYQSLLLLDISKIKARGFSLVTDEKGKIIKSVSDVKKGQTLDVELTDGKVIVEVK
ncbi:exodeoxyribonuclease VII large subunit [Lactococcus lactis subsp. lactis]|uniref:Exodeoxyribonuclease 7 large subunit n=4 Tax=Bacilli TaxID=91061 RepID=EX7L_LACLA|nr:exodeoxyribonuclease VII large subunit [Lactococcus lactis]Q9CH84.1 RecName: Full=Exodeoxyribonuclease 7 large subunit; AltName: Full=Exodeoxyribonuclease VII large subunit; Short=Exonuclease VII large subunit [Lactococcus lactis subsp. lactis Il1403]MRM75836.1 exodeoxyribonuclease VII large subunit [Lactococcus cremoris]AAK04952.1 exonuclease VII large subunit [Lactococcus lactis subsp. lactis Il1403]ARD95829.1 exodeoxyribonuclease VII large subunit [Lactococcus lactis subsp. lactis]ARE080